MLTRCRGGEDFIVVPCVKLQVFWTQRNILEDAILQQCRYTPSITVTHTRRHTELTKKLTNLMGNLCCAREHTVQFFVQFFYTVKLHSLT
jgi:hypothetical protein